jgi:hypothetical protein
MFSTVTHLASVRTLRSYLRRYRNIAISRLIIVGLTFLLIIGIYMWFTVRYQAARSNQNLMSYQLSVLLWLSWAIGLTVFISDLSLAARKAFDTSKSGIPTIILWMESIQAADMHHSSRKLRNPLTATALLFCEWYIAAGTIYSFCLTSLTELLFPWYILSYILWAQIFMSLYILAGLEISDGLPPSWSFRQLLPTFLILLLFFTLMETYAGTKHYPFSSISVNVHADLSSKSQKRSLRGRRIQNL